MKSYNLANPNIIQVSLKLLCLKFWDSLYCIQISFKKIRQLIFRQRWTLLIQNIFSFLLCFIESINTLYRMCSVILYFGYSLLFHLTACHWLNNTLITILWNLNTILISYSYFSCMYVPKNISNWITTALTNVMAKMLFSLNN